jgi:hypothetical protein
VRDDAASGTRCCSAGRPGISVTTWPSAGVSIVGAAVLVSGAQPSANRGGSGAARLRSASHALTALGSTTNERRS